MFVKSLVWHLMTHLADDRKRKGSERNTSASHFVDSAAAISENDDRVIDLQNVPKSESVERVQDRDSPN
jgi:hypothetical protein